MFNLEKNEYSMKQKLRYKLPSAIMDLFLHY